MASHNSGHSNGGNQYVRLTDKSADDSYDNGMASNEDIESGVDRKARAKRYGLIGGRMENEPMTQECLGRFSRFCHQCSDIKEDPAGGIADGEDEYMKKIIFTGLETGLAGTYCYYFQFIIHNTFCDFIFNCHCTWTWAGAGKIAMSTIQKANRNALGVWLGSRWSGQRIYYHFYACLQFISIHFIIARNVTIFLQG